MKSIDIRDKFIDFFKSKNHKYVPAAPVVPNNDPTLLFTNAGMNQFKPYFLGAEKAPFKRAVNSQPCIRVSGKHNDLEEVGIDTYHHTCFEMLGNWSFGDYYKKDAIVWAWELLTEIYQLPKEHLVATVYQDDDEAFDLWTQVTDINPNYVVRCGKKDNFWEMGNTGPCGPCSEIHLDLTPEVGGDPQVLPKLGGLTDRYMELWNLVFIQYNRKDENTLIDLPEKHVDTGAGLERIVAQLQGVNSNYDTDCFQPLIQEVSNHLNVDYSSRREGIPHRVISDHIRTVSFAIADNVLPSNEGRGYVLRRLIRRALRFASQAGKNEPFLYELISVVNDSLGGHYQHIENRKDTIIKLVKAEEEQFLRTVQSGLKLFHQVIIDLKNKQHNIIDGDIAFNLYDTHGFPLDLTQVMAKENHLSVDADGFNAALEKQRETSRKARTENLENTIDDSIIAESDITESVYNGVYINQPGGGEARIPANDSQRFGIAQHHTATHLLNASLREVFGDHISQAGSLVDVNRLRFDFTHGQAISKAELFKIEDLVNKWIRDNLKVEISEESLNDAKGRGAIAMFGEKYGEDVRVVEIDNFSIELCGGNHVKMTSHLENFQIINETSVAAGIRRIEAIVGLKRVQTWTQIEIEKVYKNYFDKCSDYNLKAIKLGKDKIIIQSIEVFNSIEEVENKYNEVVNHLKILEKELKLEQKGQASKLIDELAVNATNLKVGSGIGIFTIIENQPIPVLKDLADRLVEKFSDSVVILGSSINHKGHVVIKVSTSLVKTYKAPELINELTKITGGGGGGRDQMAQAGGVNDQKLSEGIKFLTNKYL